MQEIELKLLLEEPPAAVWSRAKKLGLTAEAPTTRMLRSVYYDTPEHALKKAGIALRLRRDGRRWIQTVKTKRRSDAGLNRVGELEIDVPDGRLDVAAIPDQHVRDEVMRQVGGTPLQPVCETVIKRASKRLSAGAGTTAELAIDTGAVHANGRSAELREVEIELIEGNPGGLFDIAHALFPEGGLRFSRLSKSERGYLLAEEGRIEPELKPRNAADICLDASQTAEEGAREMLRECVAQVLANVEVVRGLDAAEGPHQLRIGLRRLRSMFGIFAPVARSAELDRLDAEARWLGREIGSLRDLDVARDDIVGSEAAAHPDEPCLATLARTVDRRAVERRGQVRALLAGPRVQALLLDLSRFVETRGWLVPEEVEQTARLAVPVKQMAETSLARRWKKVRKHARWIDTLDAEQRHELRKQLKKLRYAIEFFASLYAKKRVSRMLKRLKELQDVFGALNDAAMIRSLLAGTDMATDDPAAQRAAGWVLGASAARAELRWVGAKAQWHELRETRPFWR